MIVIKASGSADSRTAPEIVSKEELRHVTIQHINDVRKVLDWMQWKVLAAGMHHDKTKISHLDEFYADFLRKQNGDDGNLKDWHWYKDIHTIEERHHLDFKCPEDVNLFDVLEHIADIVTAGMARSGDVYDSTLDPAIIEKAFHNTVQMLKDEVVVEE